MLNYYGLQIWNDYQAHGSLERLKENLLTDPWYQPPAVVQQSLLIFAVDLCDVDAAQLLIELGESPDLPTDDGFPLLHLAVDAAADRRESPESLRLVRLLLERGADPNRLGNDGTALHRAAGSGLIEVSRLLLEHGADIEARMLVDGELTPLMFATVMNQPRMASFGLTSGADPNPRCAAYLGGLTASELGERRVRWDRE